MKTRLLAGYISLLASLTIFAADAALAAESSSIPSIDTDQAGPAGMPPDSLDDRSAQAEDQVAAQNNLIAQPGRAVSVSATLTLPGASLPALVVPAVIVTDAQLKKTQAQNQYNVASQIQGVLDRTLASLSSAPGQNGSNRDKIAVLDAYMARLSTLLMLAAQSANAAGIAAASQAQKVYYSNMVQMRLLQLQEVRIIQQKMMLYCHNANIYNNFRKERDNYAARVVKFDKARR